MFRKMSCNFAPRLVPLLLIAACGLPAVAQSTTCTFHKVQIKTDYTSVYGINNKNAIVGTYNPTFSSQGAFILQNGAVLTIFYPGAAMTSGFGRLQRRRVCRHRLRTLVLQEFAEPASNSGNMRFTSCRAKSCGSIRSALRPCRAKARRC